MGQLSTVIGCNNKSSLPHSSGGARRRPASHTREAKGASLENRLLQVDLVREILAAMKPRAIPNASAAVP